jgi:hypothetical protein
MRTQVFANQCIDCIVVLFAHASLNCIARATFRVGCFPERSDGSAKPRQGYEAVSRKIFSKLASAAGNKPPVSTTYLS